MRSPLESLDAFLEGPHQRAFTQVIRKHLVKGRSLALVFGDGPSAARLVTGLAQTFPEVEAQLALVEAEPVRVTMRPQTQTPRVIDAPDASPADLVRSLLRQDPDAIAVTRLEGIEPQLLINTVFTGHQLVLGSSARSIDDAVARLAVGSEGLEAHIRSSIDLACEVDERGLLRRVLAGDKQGGFVELVRVDGAQVVTDPSEGVPEAPRAPASGPTFAPPIESRRSGTRAPRVAFLPVTSADADGRSRLGTRLAHRPRAASWPTCRDCGAALALIVQLDLASLPEPFSGRAGLAQLFVCTSGGCELTDERSKGVLVEVHDASDLELVEAPASLALEVVEPGVITSWRRFEEDPVADDLARLGFTVDDDDDDLSRPMRCDKLGGWPAWEQGLDWPLDETGAPFELLFQLAEDTLLAGGTPDRWDDATATTVRGERPVRVLDPNRPCHFPSVLTAEAVAFLFWHPATRRLAFRWQTG
ncbi:MAG: ATPase, T2SS/T4P/T4SS family [Myxococcaceae bacterium]|nr:ATPase, T2SS/T4P/T4SS family [Myxococcaceae bacterium]